MAAPEGNKNAEKWTLDESVKFIDSVYEYVKEHKKCTSLEEACTELGQYEKLLIYLNNKYKEIDFNSIKKSAALIKQRIINKGLNNEYNPTMSIFILKNNHDMKDKQEVDQKVTNNEPKINLNINGIDVDLSS